MAELSDGLYDILYDAARLKRYISPAKRPGHPELKTALALGLLKMTEQGGYWNEYELTAGGIAHLKQKKVRAIQVDFPGQPPLILRNKKEFEHDVLAGIVDDTLDCQMDERNGFSDDGTELFRVSVKVTDLYTLATLPEWEPV